MVGVGGIFPGAATVDALWDVIEARIDCSSEPPPNRWVCAPDQVYDSRRGQPDKIYSRRGCFLQDFRFDPTGLELDPNFLLGLDTAVHLAVHAGRQAWSAVSTTHVDPTRVGVILGNIVLPTTASSRMSDWVLGRGFERELFRAAGVRVPDEDRVAVPALNRWVAGLPAGILARALGLGGGHFTLDAACASSLFALELAIDALRSGRADAMLTGGLSRPDCLYTQMGFSQLGALSPTGHCSPFDAKGDGLVVGEGAGVVVLKRLSDALRDGDQVRAVVRGVGLSNDVDGNLLAPSEQGQLRAMRAAYAQAGWRPSDVSLVECHATGTLVGDAVELRSLGELWRGEPARPGQCVIGGVKSNIGHLLTGAGAVGLIKVILAMERGILPPTANFENPAPGLEFDGSPLRVLKAAEPWRRGDRPRRAAVSGFGFGGTNAHVLLEEAPDLDTCRVKVSVPASGRPLGVAVVGMDAHVGPWRGLVAVQRQLLCGGRPPRSARKPKAGSWGVPVASGYFIDTLEVPYGAFKIPPKELQEALPQQVLMLQVAKRALDDARGRPAEALRTGAFIGLELDPNTTNYHLRWVLRARAVAWARALGRPQAGERFEAWVDALCASVGPALDANRTMGGLGSITASRIAREFGFGGSSHTLASEEGSGLAALQVAVRALERRQIDCGIVGAVDLGGDIRALLAVEAELGWSPCDDVDRLCPGFGGRIPADGAVALVLKREGDARRDGDRIYSVIRGMGNASGDGIGALRRAIDGAHAEADCEARQIAFVEAHATGVARLDLEERRLLRDVFDSGTVVASSAGSIGHLGAASGLLSVLRANLQLYQQVLPAAETRRLPDDSSSVAEPWLRNRADGPRRAGVDAISLSGGCWHVVLEGQDDTALELEHNACVAQPTGLFVLEADTRRELILALARLHAAAVDDSAPSQAVDRLASGWHREHGRRPDALLGLTLVVRDVSALRELVDGAISCFRAGQDPSKSTVINGGELFFVPQPVGPTGELAFVYPGSGSQFPGMGRALGLAFPEIMRLQDAAHEHLRAQVVPRFAWGAQRSAEVDPRAVILSHVSLGTLATDVVRTFGLRADAAIGYSLGETTGLFAFGAWRQRDAMLQRALESDLFTTELAGPCLAARRRWKLDDGAASISWSVGVVDKPKAEVKAALVGMARAYLLIVNTPDECVIGGDASAVRRVVERLGAGFHALSGVASVHCEVVREVARAYRELHLLDTQLPEGVRFYSGAWAQAYAPTRESAADAILAQATDGVDFPATIRRAYDDGVRVFLELGPGASCTRMITKILRGRAHLALSISHPGRDGHPALVETLARLIAERVPVDLGPLYRTRRECLPHAGAGVEGRAFQLTVGITAVGPLPSDLHSPSREPPLAVLRHDGGATETGPSLVGGTAASSFAAAALSASESTARAHGAYLEVADQMREQATEQANLQLSLLAGLRKGANRDCAPFRIPAAATGEQLASGTASSPRFDREACLQLATGSVEEVFGEAFAEVDRLPTRVRLPDEPLMLVDRIMEIEGEALSMGSGRLVTEHDVLTDGWYLDGGRLPACISIEAGQADLVLSGYLGVDRHTRGLAVYRLLDAEVTFHGDLPKPQDIVRYDIRIKHFFRQGETWLFRFEFDATVGGVPLLSMRDGCAGFFTQAELDAGGGIVESGVEKRMEVTKRPSELPDLVAMRRESLSQSALEALRRGDLEGAFGEAFAGLSVADPLTLPGGRMRLIHEVIDLDPRGGRYGLGSITALANIRPDDWFLVCHFSDDRVMPGTLMYECCLHTLRVFLLRMGWIGGEEDLCWQPVAGVKSRLKCRGQVLADTGQVTYEVWVRELGYAPEPFAICDARIHADGKAIVEIRGLCLRLSGQSREGLETMWATRTPSDRGPERKTAIYDKASILAFADGNPSRGYGEAYSIFDDGKRRLARLPRPPYQFIDRVTGVEGEPFVMQAGIRAEAQFDLRPEDWFFRSNRQNEIPFAVLLEVALQACGWAAAYAGSALTSDVDLRFRNLGGEGMLLDRVECRADVLTTRVELQKVSSTAGMIIQHFSYSVWAQGRGKVYEGTSYFGFFTDLALAAQVGIRDAALHVPGPEDRARGRSFPLPDVAPYPDPMLRMIDTIDLLIPDGGTEGLGFVEASIQVDSDAWFFEAHFFEDPVWPGSLGLEAFLQLLKVYAVDRWSLPAEASFGTLSLHTHHRWIYRGQVSVSSERVSVQASVTEVNDARKSMRADGFVSVDGKVIYEIRDFSLELRP